jgi:hypothetical protein
MTESIIFNLPEEVRPEHIEKYVVPMRDDGSIHLDKIRFRAFENAESQIPQWTLRSSPWDNPPWSGNLGEDCISVWSETLNLFMAYTGDSPDPYLITSPDGITWTGNSENFGFNDWSGYFGQIGLDNLTPLAIIPNQNSIWTSPDSFGWTQVTIPGTGTGGFSPRCSAYSPSLGLWAIGQHRLGGSEYAIVTSTDGTTFTNQTTPWDAPIGFSGNQIYVAQICWSEDLDLFVAVGANDNDSTSVLVSADAVTWTSHSSPSDMLRNATDVMWMPTLGKFIATCFGFGSGTIAASSDGTTWTALTDPFGEDGCCAIEAGGKLYVGGLNSSSTLGVFVSSDGGSTFVDTICPLNSVASLAYSPSLNMLVAFGQFPSADDTGPQIATMFL